MRIFQAAARRKQRSEWRGEQTNAQKQALSTRLLVDESSLPALGT
jgi:hypothetical protein